MFLRNVGSYMSRAAQHPRGRHFSNRDSLVAQTASRQRIRPGRQHSTLARFIAVLIHHQSDVHVDATTFLFPMHSLVSVMFCMWVAGRINFKGNGS
jgi:hypothetical protein